MQCRLSNAERATILVSASYLQEDEMSIYSDQQMINHHAQGVLAQLSETLHVWRDRQRQRRELARWSDRDLHDIGLSRGDIVYEAEKPFWRA
jgi:uncharacterized protein YjiS (DUF1127 family)